MKKTNIRINDHFLIKKNDQYFLSDITDQDQWINTDNLVNHKGKNVTSKLQELIEQYNINYNVNFITEQSGGWPDSVRPNIINKQVGGQGWPFANQHGGAWGQNPLESLFNQKGGWGFKRN